MELQELNLEERIAKVLQQAAASLDAATAFYNSNQYQSARDVIQRMIEEVEAFFEKNKEEKLDDINTIIFRLAVAYDRLSFLHKYLAQYDLSLECAEKSQKYSLMIGDIVMYTKSLTNMATVYIRLLKFDKALHTLQESYDNCEKYQYPIGMLEDVIFNMSLVYQNLGDNNNAILWYERAFEIAQKVDNPERLERIMVNLGALKSSLSQYDEAIECLEKALEYNKQTNNIYTQSISLLNLADAYLASKKFEKALEFYEKAIAASQGIEQQTYVGVMYGNMAMVYLDKEYSQYNPEKGEELMLKGIEHLTSKGEKFYIIPLHERLYQFYKEQGRFEKALLHHEKYHELTKQLQSDENQKALQRTTIEYLERERKVLQEKNEELRILNNEKNEFMGIASHDLKNPLNSIQLIAQLLLNSPNNDANEQKDLLKDIIKISQRMFQIITNLLDVNAIEQGNFNANCQFVDIAEIVNALADIYTTRADEKNIAIEYDYFQEVIAYCDRNYTFQILDNLISNAVKFSPSGTKIWIHCKKLPHSVLFSVKDEGPGLTEEDHKKLFGKFARLSAQTTGGEHSTGLGLSIVKKMVEMMHGKVWCESTFGAGATFYLELPSEKP